MTGELEALGRLGIEAWAARKLLGGTLEYLGDEALPGATQRALEMLVGSCGTDMRSWDQGLTNRGRSRRVSGSGCLRKLPTPRMHL
jgi:hypothetical protein